MASWYLVFSKFFKAKNTKSAEKFKTASADEVEAIIRYRLVYNKQKQSYEKVLVYSKDDFEDVKKDE